MDMLVEKNIMVMYILKMVSSLLEHQQNLGTNIRVFESREASISGVNVPVQELLEVINIRPQELLQLM